MAAIHGRSLDVGPGFVRARECPDCGHTRCGDNCDCNCDAARSEHYASQLLASLQRILRNQPIGHKRERAMREPRCLCRWCEAHRLVESK